MTVGAAANILTIHDRVIRLIIEKGGHQNINFKTPLQGQRPGDLGWSDSSLQTFLEEFIYSAFQVRIDRKQLRPAINGISVTVGDVVIAVFRSIHKQQRPRRQTSHPSF